MQSEFSHGITIRPLRRGDREAVQAVFDGLGPQSRRLRFGGAKNVLLASDLELLSRVDENHHALVAYVDGEPVGIARLVRDGKVAEVAFAVADHWQHRGIGTVLVERLAADARAAGIECFRADVAPGNTASQALMRRLQLAA
ncbi:MAG TPA: GNAT family N-acetyltransferase [Gaiellaceae bacterium]|nr:GNAT family N-acetyltransferase [Gaiellaceae bacterium]